ncbi:hypothetical protein M0802_009486 [Mischocyttarus mexicanus]|nr:hypothetical protein M0802_009486 [Mischocyttarus mexicanus]
MCASSTPRIACRERVTTATAAAAAASFGSRDTTTMDFILERMNDSNNSIGPVSSTIYDNPPSATNHDHNTAWLLAFLVNYS